MFDQVILPLWLFLSFFNVPTTSAELKALALAMPARCWSSYTIRCALAACNGIGLSAGVHWVWSTRSYTQVSYVRHIDNTHRPSVITTNAEFSIGKPTITWQHFSLVPGLGGIMFGPMWSIKSNSTSLPGIGIWILDISIYKNKHGNNKACYKCQG